MNQHVFVLQLPWLHQLGIIFGILVARSIVVAGGSSWWLRVSEWARSRQIVPGTISGRALAIEALHGFKILFVDAAFTVILIKAGVMHLVAGTDVQTWVMFSIMFIWTEIYFYASHRFLHHPKLFWIHRYHHQANLVNPWTSVSFSVTERLILLAGTNLLPAIISYWIPLPVEGFAGYFAFNYLLNVYGHLNAEFIPPMLVKSPIGQVVNATTYHTLHHMRYRGHFGLFTSQLDKLFGTYFPDYEAVQEKNYLKGQESRFARLLRTWR